MTEIDPNRPFTVEGANVVYRIAKPTKSREARQVSLRPAGHVAPGIVGANFSVRGVPPLDLMPSKGQTPRNLNRSIVGLTYGQETKTCHGSLWRVLQPA
jgi:hypothetical protein